MLSSPSSPDRLEVSVEGPYGPASTDFLRFAPYIFAYLYHFISYSKSFFFPPNC
jgi:ferric-chelate reductase